MEFDVFISYSSKDSQTAERICTVLEADGFKCWIAPRNITPGLEWSGEIIRGIKGSKIFLIIVNKNSMESSQVINEITAAANYGLTIIPYRTDNSALKDEFEYYLQKTHWFNANIETDLIFRKLSEAVGNILSRKPHAPVVPAPATGYFSNNLTNGGAAAIQGGWIYFQNENDKLTLYKKRLDGTAEEKLCGDVPLHISPVGDWVYYKAVGKGIFKIGIDGTRRTMLSKISTKSMYIAGGYIYFQEASDTSEIYRMRTDGSDKTRLNEMKSGWVCGDADWIYFINEGGGNDLYKITTDGTKTVKLSDDACWDLNFMNDRLYYSNHSDGWKIYSIKTDGTDKQMLIDSTVTSINVTKDLIYYTNYYDNRSLYRAKLDGSAKEKLNNEISNYVSVVDDAVYYYSAKGGKWENQRILKDGIITSVKKTSSVSDIKSGVVKDGE